MTNEKLNTIQAERVIIRDTFEDDRPAGQVAGTYSTSGVLRQGSDVEGVLSIDNGALRIGYLRKLGWGRHGIAYGPYKRRPGLAFSVLFLNGHNNSQTETTPAQSMKNWVRKTIKKVLHTIGLYHVPPHPRTLLHPTEIKTNMALGWYPASGLVNPFEEGNSFVMQATDSINGILHTLTCGRATPAVWSVQNIPILYVVVLRETGAAYYVASVPGTNVKSDFPYMRPVAIDPFCDEKNLYAAVNQSVLGETAFMIDSRVYAIHVSEIPFMADWYGTAHGADLLTGQGALHSSIANIGGQWTVLRGDYVRTEKGLQATENANLGFIRPDAPTGLIHLLFDAPDTNFSFGILWRFEDDHNHWCLEISDRNVNLFMIEDGRRQLIISNKHIYPVSREVNSIQIMDTGETIDLYLNGSSIWGQSICDERLNAACGLGISVPKPINNLFFRDIEAHPRKVLIPSTLHQRDPWFPSTGTVVVSDTFDGEPGHLDGLMTSSGQRTWCKEIGKGHIDIVDSGAKVRADMQNHNPGRTAYTIDWHDPLFAALEAEIIAPGTGRGQGHKGRAGFIFLQDLDNYIILNTWLDDNYAGSTISSFFVMDGKEDLFNAVWTNVGHRIHWGIPYRLRITFTGLHYMVFIDDEPVLYRALTDVFPDRKRITINRVGLAVNWEWGDDTGSTFKSFTASASHKS